MNCKPDCIGTMTHTGRCTTAHERIESLMTELALVRGDACAFRARLSIYEEQPLGGLTPEETEELAALDRDFYLREIEGGASPSPQAWGRRNYLRGKVPGR